MGNTGKHRDQSTRPVNREAEQVLREAKIIARWAKNPFYIT